MIDWSWSARRVFLWMAALTVPSNYKRYASLVPHGIESSLATTWRVFVIAPMSPSSANFVNYPLEGNLEKRLSILLTGVDSSFLASVMVVIIFLEVVAGLVDPPCWSLKTSALGKVGSSIGTCGVPGLVDGVGVDGRVTVLTPPTLYPFC